MILGNPHTSFPTLKATPSDSGFSTLGRGHRCASAGPPTHELPCTAWVYAHEHFCQEKAYTFIWFSKGSVCQRCEQKPNRL